MKRNKPEKRIKQANCEFCGESFTAKIRPTGHGWSAYCKACTKAKVWISKLGRSRRKAEL